ncbi:DEKNAAC101404 [Brettanomyces naardenensis]|uniref:DEKNAAC101404 n=1 Tax=Brettanomyces naardenensis TaxID=13370 RepID=A0A448YI36_BRENA|nr:DEKNAAC101404 [Brettanomyces naardenensis]
MLFSLATLATTVLSLGNLCDAAPISENHKHHEHKRGATCSFPNLDELVSVGANGWAQDGECQAGQYCQYACQPGYLMGQWNPAVTSYTYPGSQQGGLFCNDNGELEKPISANDYCYKGKGTANVLNSASQNVAFCQTVLPGNEAMLIPTNVDASDSATLAVPGTDYWASTAAHYYINPPGVSTEEGCVWGSTANPYGNWSPYVAGMNMDNNGNTFAKIGWNPVYFEDSSPFKNQKPNFGIRLTCEDPSKCNGATCEINPNTYGLNAVSDSQQQADSNGAAWCMITATDNSAVSIEVFDL